jgi:hypothetical protein
MDAVELKLAEQWTSGFVGGLKPVKAVPADLAPAHGPTEASREHPMMG